MDSLIIVVTGIPRSGTSMMMRMLEAGGVPCVYEQEANEFNPDGYYEASATMHGDFSAVPDGHAAKCLFELHNVAVPDVRVIVMRRNFASSVASGVRRAVALGNQYPATDPAFLQEQLDSNRLWASSRPHAEVWYEDVLRNPTNEILRVARLLGREPGFCPLEQELDLAAMRQIPDAGLNHG